MGIMISDTKTKNRGFIASISAMLLGMGTMAFALAVSSSAVIYSDAVLRKELRFLAESDARSCLETMSLMLAKDYFMCEHYPLVELDEYHCKGSVEGRENYANGIGRVILSATSTWQGIAYNARRTLELSDFGISEVR